MTELFENFEVNQKPWWSMILRLFGASLALHGWALFALLYVPALRDAFNIVSLISDASFVDKPYQRTEIGDDIHFVELGREKFRYPDGYWALEGQPVALAPIPPPPPPPQFVAQAPPQLPAPEPSPSLSPSSIETPSPSPAISGSPVQAVAQAGVSPSATPVGQKMTPEQAQAELDKTVKENNLEIPKEGEINKKALKDFADYANELKNQGKLDLDEPFEVVIEAVLDGNGKLKDPKFIKKEGDPNLVDLFGRMVAALNDSGFLVYLKPIDRDNPGTKVVFTIKQGETEVLASVESEVSSDDSARILAKGFNAALMIGAESRAGKDEEQLLRNTSAAPNGRKITFNFTMPREAVVDLIKKQLAPS